MIWTENQSYSWGMACLLNKIFAHVGPPWFGNKQLKLSITPMITDMIDIWWSMHLDMIPECSCLEFRSNATLEPT